MVGFFSSRYCKIFHAGPIYVTGTHILSVMVVIGK